MQSTNNMAIDVFGNALVDYQKGNYTEDIVTNSSLEEEDVIPLPHLFRSFEQMPKIEQIALDKCQGNVLDIGCGAGSHSLHLQKKGLTVTALDISEGAISVTSLRGVNQTVCADIMHFSSENYDTLLLLMNGIGIVGNLSKLSAFLNHFKKLLAPKGSIILDSSDIIYMYETENGYFDISDIQNYYGEVEFTMSYKNEVSKPFNWLYIDFDTLKAVAFENGFDCEMLFEGNHFDYLAKLSPSI
ncbi:class I SAM-dependent methyltransferase [Aurantibacter sp.]|uniref:class I SAM-dependent methyltransferase n=1 Tax=Aurantibacter sp. TaxID=2807103 RepID=UPI003266DF2E